MPSCKRFQGYEVNTLLTDDTSCTVTDLIVLALRQLHQKLGNLVLNLHLTQNSCAIICDCNLSVWRNEDLVQTCAYNELREACWPRCTRHGPLGPSDVLMMLDTVLAARMCD